MIFGFGLVKQSKTVYEQNYLNTSQGQIQM